MSHEQHVGIGKMALTSDPETLLVAPNLGSCVGVAVYDKKRKLGGMIHCLLPLSKSDPAKAAENPCMYVDTGLAAFFTAMLSGRARKEDLVIYAVGGARIHDDNHVFEIGKKNVTVLRKFLWKNNLLLSAEDFGKDVPRTLSLDVATGKVCLKIKGEKQELN